jgi:hypothetical protein
MTDKIKRLLTDAAGYVLVFLGVALGWLPGPGGLPLILAGLGLLSINNAWAKRWREWLVANAGDAVKWLFPKHHIVEDLYDLAAVLLVGLVGFLIYHRAAIWQISLASILFFVAMTIVGLNRDRASALKTRIRGKKTAKRNA